MKKSQRIQPVKKVVEFKERQAAVALGIARNDLQIKQARLAELVSYQAEYAQDFHEKGKQGLGVLMLKTFQSFLEKLGVAIREQEQRVVHAERIAGQKQQVWMKTRQQVQIYNNVLDRFSKEESQHQEKQEQKFNDELASKLPRKR